MNFIQRLFKKKKKIEIKLTPEPEQIVRPVLRISKAAKNRAKKACSWYEKTYKGKAHRMPFAKFATPEKYF